MKFRKKPVVIEAIKYQAELGNNRMMNWLAQQNANVKDWLFFDGEITIPTIEGNMKASDGDWIIKGVAGEFYPCKPDIFEKTYAPADEPEQPSRQELLAMPVEERRPYLEASAEHVAPEYDQPSREALLKVMEAANIVRYQTFSYWTLRMDQAMRELRAAIDACEKGEG